RGSRLFQVPWNPQLASENVAIGEPRRCPAGMPEDDLGTIFTPLPLDAAPVASAALALLRRFLCARRSATRMPLAEGGARPGRPGEVADDERCQLCSVQ